MKQTYTLHEYYMTFNGRCPICERAKKIQDVFEEALKVVEAQTR